MRRTTLLLLPVALPFSAGALALRLLLHHAPSRIAKDLAQPLPVVTSWGSFGAACFTVLALTIALSAVALIVAMLRLARTEEHASDAPSRDGGARHAVACVATLALAGAFAWPAIFSSDPYAYAAYGSLALHGFDPYAPVAATVHGPLVDAARYQWNGAFPPCVYGPLFVTLAAAIVAATAAGGAALTLGAFRLSCACAFLVGIVFLDDALATRAARERAIALCAYGLNPVVLWAVAEGHNDAFVMLALFAAAALVRRGHGAYGALLAGLSPLLKAPGALFAAAAALNALYSRAPGARRRAGWALAGLTLAALFVLPPLRPALAATEGGGHYQPETSLQALLGFWPAVLAALAAAAYGWRHLAGGERSGYAWLAIAAIAALPNVYPWYAVWLVPAALAAGESGASLALWGTTLVSVVRYLPDATGNLGEPALRTAAAVAALPLAFLLVERGRHRTAQQKAAVPS